MTKRWMVTVAVLSMVSAGLVNAAEDATKKDAVAAVPLTPAMITAKNLQAAYIGESNAKVRYGAFAAKADQEGYKSVSALFRALAKSEGIHADHHLAMLGVADIKHTVENPDVKTTKENLEAAMKAGAAAKDTMYPAFAAQAVTDKQDKPAMTFNGAVASEKELVRLCGKALAELDSWKPAGKQFFVCTVCGYASIVDPLPKTCPVCDSPKEKFEIVK